MVVTRELPYPPELDTLFGWNSAVLLVVFRNIFPLYNLSVCNSRQGGPYERETQNVR